MYEGTKFNMIELNISDNPQMPESDIQQFDITHTAA